MVWGYFCELGAARGSSGFGPASISFTEIQAWSSLMGVQLTPWEVSMIRRLDVAFLTTTAKGLQSGKPHR